MKNFCDLIDRLGFADLAKVLGTTESHIRTMRARRTIPPEYWGEVLELALKGRIRGLSWAVFRKWRTEALHQPAQQRRAS